MQLAIWNAIQYFPYMTPKKLIATLARPSLVREIHHLLWVEPRQNRGVLDEGWNCRDHALVVATLCQMLGFNAYTIHGAASFVQGATGGRPPVGLGQDPHAWAAVDGGGMHDLSVRLDRTAVPHWTDWQVLCISGSVPHAKRKMRLHYPKTALEYEDTVAAASHRQAERCAIYLAREYEPLTKAALSASMAWSNSILTDDLRDQIGEQPDFHARFALHLFELLGDPALSLTELPPTEAWKDLTLRDIDVIGAVCRRGKIQ